MGIFSLKTLTCERCGKEYETRITLGKHICKECKEQLAQKEKAVSGYISYANGITRESYTEEQMDQIVLYRQQILDRIKNEKGISIEELQTASNNYKNLTEKEALSIVQRRNQATVFMVPGASISRSFIAPTAYEATIVDMKDVFAVGYTSNLSERMQDQETILCVAFTYDPYIPAIPMYFMGDLGMFDSIKSKTGRRSVGEFFEYMCSNLEFPVQDMKKLEKQIRQEGFKREVDEKRILDIISRTYSTRGPFGMKYAVSFMSEETTTMLSKCGYIQLEKMDLIMRLDKHSNYKYWSKYLIEADKQFEYYKEHDKYYRY